MFRYLSKSTLLLFFTLIFICGIYPIALWLVGQTLFPFQAQGSMLTGPDGKLVGSKLIAQPFTKDEYFQPRPSAASYDASASASSALSASNYALRDRIARMIGPLAVYQGGAKSGQPVAADIKSWFDKDSFQGQPHIVEQWANLHNSLAQAWVSTDPKHATLIDNWTKNHPDIVAKFIKDNPSTPTPKAVDLAVVFLQQYSHDNPGKFPLASAQDIQSIFFDMWRQDNPAVELQALPGDYVTTSASGLDPHITLQNAEFQLDRVATKWANTLKRSPAEVKTEIKKIVDEHTQAPFAGLIGEKFINVLEVNLELNKRYGTGRT
jgi:K+-transporting ATPase ATPase C chain